VNCILQDNYGFIWFGTDDGLNRYDGHQFTPYRHDPDDPLSLSHNRVWSLFEDSAGTLWVGTYGGGLNRLDRSTGQFSRFDADDFRNLTDEPKEFRNVVWAIDEHPAGVLWIATYGGGLVKLELETETFTSYAPDPTDPALGGHEWITALLVDRSGLIWIGTHSEGLDRFDPGTGQTVTFRHDPDDPDSLGHDWVTEIIQDRSGVIWIGTSGRGLDRLDPETGTFSHYRHNPEDPASLGNDAIWSISEDPGGWLWIGTYDGGLDAFDPSPGTFVHFRHDSADPHSLSSDRVRCVFLDRSNSLWVGTRGAGVSMSNPASRSFTHYPGDPDDPNRSSDYAVLALHQDKGGLLWIGTEGDGLDLLDRATGEWRHLRNDPTDPNSLGSDSVRDIHEDSLGHVWLATDHGLYRFEPGREQFVRLPHNPPDPGDVKRNTIYAIFEDSQGILWLGTYGRGLSELDPATGEFAYHLQRWPPESAAWPVDGLGNNWVMDIVEDESGNLWIATQDGLSLHRRQSGQWNNFRHDPLDPGSLSNDWIMSLHLDGAGDLWLGTLGGGLDRLALSQSDAPDPAVPAFVHYTEQDGLANNMVLDVVESGGYLWLATANGLSRLDPRTGVFKSYDASDGLLINEFGAAYASASGELIVGGINGFMSFQLDKMRDNTYVPPVVLTSLQQDGIAAPANTALEDLAEVTFRWPANSFEFSFAALNYTLPAKNQHAYKLEGFESGWNDIGNRRFGRYTSLPGGTYTLRLKGSNNDGVWNEEGTSIKVTIVPPFWQTWWFWGILAVALAGGAFGAVRLRLRSLESRSHELQRQVDERTAELRSEIDQRLLAEKALRRHEREQAIAEERNRLARELHDSVTQALYGVTLYSEAAAGHLSQGRAGRAAENLTALQDTVHQALAEMRLLVFELRPPILKEQGLVAALQARLLAVEGRAGLRTEFRVNLDRRLPPQVEEGFYRIALEALNNTLKHAQATQIQVCLQQADPPSVGIVLEVMDDGLGFEPTTASQRGGLGLAAMAERAAGLSTSLSIVSNPGSGTRIRIAWPGDEEGTPHD
jgi:signal transduction histidine kinase/ligand-binding sensor domain-containing protein